jgi:hypothetical protein
MRQFARDETCEPALQALQRRLDGESADLTPDVEAHLAICHDCRERFRFARSLMAVLPSRYDAAEPSSIWTERVVGAIVTDGRRIRIRRLGAAWALAAGVLAAVWLTRPLPSTSSDGSLPVAANDHTRTPNLQAGFAEAGSALAALTRRAAAETVGQGKVLVPPVEVPPGLDITLDRASRPFDHAREGLSKGFEPVATSARRAVSLFWQDLPEDRK